MSPAISSRAIGSGRRHNCPNEVASSQRSGRGKQRRVVVPTSAGVASSRRLLDLLGGVGGHWLDRRNCVEQHRDEQLDTRRQEAARVFDTTIVTFSRISVSANAILWGVQALVATDSVAKLAASFNRNVRFYESQGHALQSL